MKKKNSRHVVPHAGGWAVKQPGAKRSSAIYRTQQAATDRAREIVHRAGGGEVVIHRPNGRIRDSDTIAPARDPFPPRDTK